MTKFEEFCQDAGVPAEKVLVLVNEHVEEVNKVAMGRMLANMAHMIDNTVISADLTAADLEHIIDYVDLAFATLLYYGIAGNDPEKNDILRAHQLVDSVLTQLAAKRAKRGVSFALLRFFKAHRLLGGKETK